MNICFSKTSKYGRKKKDLRCMTDSKDHLDSRSVWLAHTAEIEISRTEVWEFSESAWANGVSYGQDEVHKGNGVEVVMLCS